MTNKEKYLLEIIINHDYQGSPFELDHDYAGIPQWEFNRSITGLLELNLIELTHIPSHPYRITEKGLLKYHEST